MQESNPYIGKGLGRNVEKGKEHVVKNLPAMQKTQLQSQSQEDPLEKEMATHSSILAWRIPWTEEPGRLQSTGSQRVEHNLVTKPPPPLFKLRILLSSL